ncbi:hypothetical protein OROMI_012584 [Orobanche minor]
MSMKTRRLHLMFPIAAIIKDATKGGIPIILFTHFILIRGCAPRKKPSLEGTLNLIVEKAQLWRERMDSHMSQVEGTFCRLGQQANQLTTTIENLHRDQFPKIIEVSLMEQCHTVVLQSDMEYEYSTSRGEEIIHVEFVSQQDKEENTLEMGTDKKEEVQVTENTYIRIDNEGHVPPIKYPMECHEQESLLFRNNSSGMKIIKDLSVLDFEQDIFTKGVKFNEFENKGVIVGELGKKEVMASCHGMNDAYPRLIWMVACIFIVSL